ncbi:MAG: nicotinamide mononucleotide deamidase-related protein [Candidatus Brockarchaeota archaeon]|nr:nicotinamide mononucleotide deamidase-related protein [Candidatus Brockarchaeota archaeon]
MAVYAELICVGNELLTGKVVNTNASWLAEKATGLGVEVRRIEVVGDDLGEISDAIRLALGRKPSFIITTGGLGPTYDDMTLAGVARAIGVELEVNEKALEMVRRKYESMSLELTPARIKMANLPKGGTAIANPAGTAPGCLVEFAGTKIVSLPGVPSEMQAIFAQSVAPMLEAAAGGMVFKEASIVLQGIPESALAPILDEVRKRNLPAYFKSHPKMSEGVPLIEVHVSAKEASGDKAERIVRKGVLDLKEAAILHGAKILGER